MYFVSGIPSNTNLKEGTLWNVANDGPPPEGFTVYTIESGLTVLRRKRQRNLNKLGIGGFVVRQRQTTAKAQADDEKEGDGTQPSGGKQFNEYLSKSYFFFNILQIFRCNK